MSNNGYTELKLDSDKKILSGHFFVTVPIDKTSYKVGDIVPIKNFKTGETEECKITSVHPSEDKSGKEKGTMVHFEAI